MIRVHMDSNTYVEAQLRMLLVELSFDDSVDNVATLLIGEATVRRGEVTLSI